MKVIYSQHNWTAGSNKGQTKQGDMFNSVFALGTPNPNYTSSAVVENFTGDGSTTEFTVAWTPLVEVRNVTVNGEVKTLTTDYTVDTATGKVTFTSAPANNAVIKVAYAYDNVYIPQNDLPIINAELTPIALAAKARRIAIYYKRLVA